MLRQKLIINICLLHLVGFLSLHTKYWYFDKHMSLKELTPDSDFQRTHQGAHPTSYQRSASPEENYSSHNRSRSSRWSWSFRSPRLRGLWGRWLRRIRSPWISVNHPKLHGTLIHTDRKVSPKILSAILHWNYTVLFTAGQLKEHFTVTCTLLISEGVMRSCTIFWKRQNNGGLSYFITDISFRSGL